MSEGLLSVSWKVGTSEMEAICRRCSTLPTCLFSRRPLFFLRIFSGIQSFFRMNPVRLIVQPETSWYGAQPHMVLRPTCCLFVPVLLSAWDRYGGWEGCLLQRLLSHFCSGALSVFYVSSKHIVGSFSIYAQFRPDPRPTPVVSITSAQVRLQIHAATSSGQNVFPPLEGLEHAPEVY